MLKSQESGYSYDGYIPPVLYTPNVIDIEVTPRCEFECPGCWGTKAHECGKELSNRQWIKLFEKWSNIGDDWTERVVITGGEPLLRKNLGEIACWLVDSGRQVTLSTTGLDRHEQLPKLLEYLYSIGLPIDGPSKEINSRWRNHRAMSDGGLEIAVNALRLVQNSKPDLKTAVRTIVHPGNIDHIPLIPDMLQDSGIDTSRLRWILYELNNKELVNNNSWSKNRVITSSQTISDYRYGADIFYQNIEQAGQDFKELTIRRIGDLAGRYFIINPSGECRAVVAKEDAEDMLEEREYGNMYNDFEEVIELLNQDIGVLGQFSAEAADSPEYFCSQLENPL